MITTLIFDFSRVILFPRDKKYLGGLNKLHDELSAKAGYNFLDYFELNDRLLALLEKMKERYDLYVFTTGHIQNVPEVKKRISRIFKEIYSVEQIPFDKKDPRGYSFVAEKLHHAPHEILYIDDTIQNITVAKLAGFHTLVFKNNDQLLKALRKFCRDQFR